MAFHPIKIALENSARIEAALAIINGRAKGHTYATFNEVEASAEFAEKSLLALVSKKMASGACLADTSGGAVPNAYKYKRQGTGIHLERRSSAWWLTEVSAVTLYNEGGKRHLILTPEQDAKAVATFRQQYRVKAAVTIELAN